MKKKYFRFIILYFLLVMSLFNFPPKVTATVSTANEIGYHIYSIAPENQINNDNSFFDLRMKPNQEQTIEFVIANTSDIDQTYTIELNQAYTNNQGYIDYSENKNSPSNINKQFSIEQIAKIQKNVTVHKQSTTKIPINLKMPSEQYDGEILAGIRVIKQPENHDSKSIVNEYGYILGLRLTETDKELQRLIQLNNIKPEVSFGKTSVVITLQNPIMESYGNLNYEVKIQNKEKPDIIKQKSFTGLQMAPNSLYNFSVDWDGERIVAGDYRMNLRITDKKSNKWEFTKDFKIQTQEANKVNKVVIRDTSIMGNKLIIILSLIIILIFTIVYYAWYKRKSN